MGEPELTPMQVIELAASAIKKVHMHGRRGVETVTNDEIVAVIGMVLDMGADALVNLERALNEDRDAARYRWIRDGSLDPDIAFLTGEDLDRAIDAAMAATLSIGIQL
ncbi:hypothetical protein MALG_02488 [Marinovum algicola DG 898]|nr:hypothetical protein MALG_02488 [Marinovum algicola DG 898]